MAYRVAKRFRDKDTGKVYEENAPYINEDKDRVSFLVEKGYLDEQKRPPELSVDEYHKGGGYYELPNGETVRGRETAEQTLADLEKR